MPPVGAWRSTTVAAIQSQAASAPSVFLLTARTLSTHGRILNKAVDTQTLVIVAACVGGVSIFMVLFGFCLCAKQWLRWHKAVLRRRTVGQGYNEHHAEPAVAPSVAPPAAERDFGQPNPAELHRVSLLPHELACNTEDMRDIGKQYARDAIQLHAGAARELEYARAQATTQASQELHRARLQLEEHYEAQLAALGEEAVGVSAESTISDARARLRATGNAGQNAEEVNSFEAARSMIAKAMAVATSEAARTWHTSQQSGCCATSVQSEQQSSRATAHERATDQPLGPQKSTCAPQNEETRDVGAMIGQRLPELPPYAPSTPLQTHQSRWQNSGRLMHPPTLRAPPTAQSTPMQRAHQQMQTYRESRSKQESATLSRSQLLDQVRASRTAAAAMSDPRHASGRALPRHGVECPTTSQVITQSRRTCSRSVHSDSATPSYAMARPAAGPEGRTLQREHLRQELRRRRQDLNLVAPAGEREMLPGRGQNLTYSPSPMIKRGEGRLHPGHGGHKAVTAPSWSMVSAMHVPAVQQYL